MTTDLKELALAAKAATAAYIADPTDRETRRQWDRACAEFNLACTEDAILASQAARIAELEDANNDALAAEAKLNLVRKRMERLEAENKALKQVADFDYLETIVAENRLLRNLLKPFAEDADKWAETVPDDHRPLCTEPNSKTAHPGSETDFTVGDLRRARATLKGETS